MMVSANSWARPLKGFNTGPYLVLEGGVIQATFDRDENTGDEIGHAYDPAVGLIFGWNVWDSFSAEIEGRYSTAKLNDTREHLVSANVYGRYSFILDALTDFDTLRILPTLKGGLSFRVASLPGDPSSSDKAITTFGWGPSFGGGLSFIVKKYIFFGFNVQEDLVFFKDVYQTLNVGGVDVPNVLIYKGGFYPQFSAMAFVGVHY